MVKKKEELWRFVFFGVVGVFVLILLLNGVAATNVTVQPGQVIVSGNVTSSNWFVGLFNWVLDSFAQVYFSFDGSTLSFNETKLNETIDSRVENSFDQDLNTYDSVSFSNVTITERICMFNSTSCPAWIYSNSTTMVIGVD